MKYILIVFGSVCLLSFIAFISISCVMVMMHPGEPTYDWPLTFRATNFAFGLFVLSGIVCLLTALFSIFIIDEERIWKR